MNKFYVVAFRYDEKDIIPNNARVWTISTNQDEPGWQTDGGYDGYGLTRTEAQFLVDAANEKIERENS